MSRSKAAKRKQRIGASQASRKTAVTLDQSPWDMGATGQANQRGLVVEDRGDLDADTGKVRNPNGVKGARRVDMLEVYLNRGAISQRGYNAGLILRQAWSKTEMGQSCPFAREQVDTSARVDDTISVMIDRISAYRTANRNTATGDESIISHVVCSGAGVGSMPEYRAWRHDIGLMHMRDALERLADNMEGSSVSNQA